MKQRGVAALLGLFLIACAPTNLPVETAEAQCMQYTLGGGGRVTVGMSAGTGEWNGGGWDRWGGSGVGVGMSVATELPSGRTPDQIYASCVQRRAGQPPVTPFDKRPELGG